MVRVLSFCSYRTGVAGDKLRAANIINKYIRAKSRKCNKYLKKYDNVIVNYCSKIHRQFKSFVES